MHIGIYLQNSKLTEAKLVPNVNSMLFFNQSKILNISFTSYRLSFTGKILTMDTLRTTKSLSI